MWFKIWPLGGSTEPDSSGAGLLGEGRPFQGGLFWERERGSAKSHLLHQALSLGSGKVMYVVPSTQ